MCQYAFWSSWKMYVFQLNIWQGSKYGFTKVGHRRYLCEINLRASIFLNILFLNITLIWNQSVQSGIWFFWSLPYLPLMVFPLIEFGQKNPSFLSIRRQFLENPELNNFMNFTKSWPFFERKVKKSKIAIFSLLQYFPSIHPCH